MIYLKVINKEGNKIAENAGDREVNLVVEHQYEEGDTIWIKPEEVPGYYWLQIDDALGKSLVYMTGEQSYEIPFSEKRMNISNKVFSGDVHLLSMRKAKQFEIEGYRNLAYNVNDQHGDVHCYPHAYANVETRGESVFAAKNAIDGVTANVDHGKWPYASWGINRRDDAEFTLDFGRTVEIDRIIIYTRADFPHDNWWIQGTLEFSDDSNMIISLQKTGEGQEFVLEKKRIQWLKLKELIKADDPSPFPALTQIEVYGREVL